MKCKVKRKTVPLGILLNDISGNHVRNFQNMLRRIYFIRPRRSVAVPILYISHTGGSLVELIAPAKTYSQFYENILEMTLSITAHIS